MSRVRYLTLPGLSLVTSVEPDGGLIVESSSLTLPGDGGLIRRAPYRVMAALGTSVESMADLKKIEREIPHHMNSE